MGLFDDVLRPTPTPQRGGLFDDVLEDAVRFLAPPSPPSATLSAPGALSLGEWFPQATGALQQASRGLLSGDPLAFFKGQQRFGTAVGSDLLNTAWAPVSMGVESAIRAGQGLPQLPIASAVRLALRGRPEDSRLDQAFRLATETAAAPVLYRVVSGTVQAGTAPLRTALRRRQVRAQPIETLVREARYGGRFAEISEALRGTPKHNEFRRAFGEAALPSEALAARRRPVALLPQLASERGAARLPEIKPGDLVRFGKQVHRVVSVDPTAQKAVLALAAGRTVVVPLTSLTQLRREGMLTGEGSADVPQAPEIGREPAGVQPSATVSLPSFSATHPGVTRLPRDPFAPEVPVVPISRQEADRLLGQSVELRPGFLALKVFRVVPPEAAHAATGLQYWYKYDLPATTGLRYTRIVKTPSEALEVREPLRTLTRVRRQAIQLVTRQLREQALLLNQQRLGLRQRVVAAGGIKPRLGFGRGLSEELRAIQPFLRSGGRAIDDLATELGFENGEALREALIASRGAKIPILAQLRQQAIQIVDSEQGNRILEALQAKGATSKAITAVVKDVTQQTQQALAAGQQQVRGILTQAQRKAMTPAQLARFARLQRIEPGATELGPGGGTREAPLEPADVRRVEAATAQVVPPEGQPTGTPPVIPTSRALITSEAPQPSRDLNQFQSTPFSGLDPSRAAQLIDGRPQGPTWQRVVNPLRRGELAFRQEQRQVLQQLFQVSRGIPEGSPADRQIFLFLEGRASAESLSPSARATAQWMVEQFDQLLERVNQARASIGKRPILRRKGYITHISEEGLWEALREVFGGVAPEATKTLATEFVERMSGRTPGFRFGLPRRGGPFQEQAIRAFRAYLPAALRVIHLSEPSRLATVYVNRSLANTPNAHRYFSQLIRQVATGEQGAIAKITPPALLQASNWLRRRFGKGTILGNLSSVLQQPFTLPATVSATGTEASTAAAGWLARGDGASFALQWSPTIQARTLQQDVDLTTLSSRWDQAMGYLFGAADRTMVSHAFLAGYLAAIKRGADFQQAIQAAEQVALRTQSGFLEADLAPVFRDAITASVLQFQNTINGVFNFIKFDIPRQRNPLWGASAFVGTFAAMAAIYDYLGLPHPDRIEEFIPGSSTMRSGGPVGIRLLVALSNLGNADPRKRTEAIRALKSSGAALLFGAGGNQLRKSFEGIQAVRHGGVVDKRGRRLFRIRGLPEQARAVAFGPFGTKAGQAFLKQRQVGRTRPRRSLLDAFSTAPISSTSSEGRGGGLFDDVLGEK